MAKREFVDSRADDLITTYLDRSMREDLSKVAMTAQAELEALRDEVTQTHDPDFSRLAAWRLLASNSLAASGSCVRKGWDSANLELKAALERGEVPSVGSAKAFHRCLGVGSSDFRVERIFTADEEYLSPALVLESLARLDITLANPHVAPLYRAYCAYVGVVTIHPFVNGNGRVARLLADAFLLGNDYLPLCFPSPVCSHVAQTKGGVRRDVSGSFEAFLLGVLYAYRVVLRKLPSEKR